VTVSQRTPPVAPRRQSIPPGWLWFGVLGGPAAWSVHVVVAWSVMELACISPLDGPWVDQRAGSPGPVAWSLAVAGTVGPWLVCAFALAVTLVLRQRHRRQRELMDELARERTGLLLVLGLALAVLSLAAVTGGLIGLAVLEPCG
jgi:hypothetical protein